MSNMEFNCGKIIHTNLSQYDIEELCKEYSQSDVPPTWADDWNDYFDEYMYDMGFVKINGKLYKILEHNCSEDFDGKIIVNSDGSIEFLTYHYNGGGHWTEVLSNLIKNEGK